MWAIAVLVLLEIYFLQFCNGENYMQTSSNQKMLYFRVFEIVIEAKSFP